MKTDALTKEEMDALAQLEFKIEEEGYLNAEEYVRYIELKDKLDEYLLKGE